MILFLPSDQLPDPASVDPVEFGDEVRGALHAMVRNVAEVVGRRNVACFGCDAGQGYLFGAPEPAAMVTSALKAAIPARHIA